MLSDQLQGPGWAVAWPRHRASRGRCALCEGLAVRLLDPRVRRRTGSAPAATAGAALHLAVVALTGT